MQEHTASATESVAVSEHPLEFIFHPRSIAVVGASTDRHGQGNNFVRGPRNLGFPGPIYPINPKASEILGFKAYPSVLDVPGPLDYVISSIPAAAVPALLRQCGQKGVKLVHLFTAGFRETGDRARTDLEQHILRVAREEGIRLLGPNCMGIYYPEGGLSFSPEFAKEGGNIGMLSQSGTNASETANFGAARGLKFSKVISFGNALDITEADLLDYFAADPNTHIIGAYIEGLADGRHFFRVLREAASKKPVVILKGGRTQAGTRAIASHTGSMVGTDVVWDTLCRQTGAIRVYGVEELVDILMTFSTGVWPQGNRVAILGGGGGASVLAADDCAAQGLQVPLFSPAVQEQLRPLVHEAGTSVRNPIDAGALMRSKEMHKVAEIIGKPGEVDVFLIHMSAAWSMRESVADESPEEAAQSLAEASRVAGRPFYVVIRNEGGRAANPQSLERFTKRCVDEGIPVFPSMTRAANALQKLLSYRAREGQ